MESMQSQLGVYHQRERKCLQILCRIFSIVSVILLIITVVLTINSSQKLKTYSQCTGTIVDFYETSAPRGTDSHRSKRVSPVVAYTVDGKNYDFVGNYYSSGMKIGQQISILYHNQDHSNAVIRASLYFAPIIVGVLTLLFTLLYITCTMLKKKRSLAF